MGRPARGSAQLESGHEANPAVVRANGLKRHVDRSSIRRGSFCGTKAAHLVEKLRAERRNVKGCFLASCSSVFTADVDRHNQKASGAWTANSGNEGAPIGCR